MTLKDFLEKHGEAEITKEQEKQIKDFLKLKESKRWKPYCGEKYYYISCYGDINYRFYDTYDIFFYLTNNCFKTKEEAEFHLEKLKVYHELQLFADENNEEIDWKDEKTKKWFFIFDHNKLKFCYNFHFQYQHIGNIYFSSRELMKQAIKKVGKNRIKKYLFGVEDE